MCKTSRIFHCLLISRRTDAAHRSLAALRLFAKRRSSRPAPDQSGLKPTTFCSQIGGNRWRRKALRY
ncbi:hypothetical protein SKAU_G00043910 [Synaphobranchus kaupii]|uniref:Uncharacterized protein n=1 Tax=Synaphobranchus kaupii TaxID=118154 RepID=A0A9Q1G230_SYNKA|nr:hypothetical protein SKAU_G00043910 [Synaphobranchus kaupii]